MKRRRGGNGRRVRPMDDGDGSDRLDAAVRERFSLSWAKARERITRGKIWVDGTQILDIGHRLLGVDFEFVEDARAESRPEDLLLPPRAFRAVDRDIVVVEKPAGLLTVPFEGKAGDTLVRLLGVVLSRREHRKKRPPLFVVHRLDLATSGVLVFARTRLARDRLKDQFRNHTAHRRYFALVHGHVESTTVKTHLVHDRGDGTRGSVENAPAHTRAKLSGGQIAITHVEALEKLDATTLIACQLETGRTNQIRIHLSELGHPLVGETVYGHDGAEPPTARLCLHAAELGFTHPRSGAPLKFQSEIPEAMQQEIDRRRLR
jgi:23S rRNA pseudouridine1911/1915/1917 synthase